jgi:hypothetical protein
MGKTREQPSPYILQALLYRCRHLLAAHPPARKGDAGSKTQEQRWEKYKNGRERERPHLGFRPPKKFLQSLPPCGTSMGAGSFPMAEKNSF